MTATCDRPMRGGGTCGLYAGHRGRCSTVTFDCDGPCGKRQRGYPTSTARDSDGVPVAQFCFVCTITAAREVGYPAPPRRRRRTAA